MAKKYWSALFTGTTWEEFLNQDEKAIGFKETKKNSVQRISEGDYLICYISGVSRFIGILEVISPLYLDQKRIWKSYVFP